MNKAGIWKPSKPLVLASRSAARKAMLEAAGLPIVIQSPSVDERVIEASVLVAGGDGKRVAEELALRKAMYVSNMLRDAFCVGADQTLECEGECLSKPMTSNGARQQVLRLSGRWHTLHSAASVVHNGDIVCRISNSARIKFRSLDETAVRNYINMAGPDIEQCVGAYQLEALGVHLFEAIDGDYWTILGLPMIQLCAALRSANLLAW